MTGVADSWEVHPCALFLNFNALELGVVELSCVSLVLNFSRCSLVFEVSELVLSMLLARSGLVFVIKWGNKAANVLVVD